MALYCYAILATKHQTRLRVLLAKLTWAVFIACGLFLLFPAKFSFAIPTANNPILATMYTLLHSMDSSYNQAPSLHVIFCVIFYNEFKKLINSKTALFLVRGWLVLVAASTWFTFQHHCIDIFTGIIVGVAINYFITRPQHYVASIYLMISGLSLLIASSIQETSPFTAALSYYLCLSFALISIQYLRNKPKSLGKSHSTFSLLAWLLYAPYLLAYRLLWSVNNYKIESHQTTSNSTSLANGVITKVSDKLLVGPRLSNANLIHLPADCMFIDLSAEVAEASAVDRNQYLFFPMLDLQAPCSSQLVPAVRAVQTKISNKETVYLHCAMGYSRSFLIACIYLIAYQDYSPRDAKNYLFSLNNTIKLPESYVSNDDLLVLAKHCIAFDAKQPAS